MISFQNPIYRQLSAFPLFPPRGNLSSGWGWPVTKNSVTTVPPVAKCDISPSFCDTHPRDAVSRITQSSLKFAVRVVYSFISSQMCCSNGGQRVLPVPPATRTIVSYSFSMRRPFPQFGPSIYKCIGYYCYCLYSMRACLWILHVSARKS